MLVPVLVAIVLILGIVFLYIYVIGPRLNPINRADTFLKQNLVDQAILEYKKLIDADPGNSVAHFRLALICFDRGENDEGVLHLEDVLKINKFNYEVEKIRVQRKLAEAYLDREDDAKAFQLFFDILKAYPGDLQGLYHVSFMLLGQENFELAQRFFERLIKQGKKDFEILFGAGMAAFQNQKTSEAIEFFRDALEIDPHSDIANLAMSFALQRKRDHRAALNQLRVILDNSTDDNALLVAKRLYGIIAVIAKRPAEGVKIFEDILEYVRREDMSDEIQVILYDLGFTAVHADMLELATASWNELYQLNRSFRNIQYLTTLLRREMDSRGMPRDGGMTVIDYTDEWIKQAFPADFLWDICGLKSHLIIDLAPILAAGRAESVRDDVSSSRKAVLGNNDERIEDFFRLDQENFRIIANRVTAKLGYRVDEILPTYREADGVDFLAYSLADKEKTLVWVRRWKDVRVGEIPLRNFAQAINDAKARQGLFITATELTESGEASLRGLSKVRVILPDELGALLDGLV